MAVEIMRLPAHSADSSFSGWDGYHSDSYFSGIVIKLSPDGEQYQVGTYIEKG